MARVVKRLPIDAEWAKRAYCKGMDPDFWDLDAIDPRTGEKTMWKRGRYKCITKCPVREDCLRRALRSDDYITSGVVRGGVAFDKDQVAKKTSECIFCHYRTARGETPGLCWICRRFGPCALGCGRLVKRRPDMDSYNCGLCNKEGADVGTPTVH